ncbi:MAG: ribonuclease D [Chromatiaceae bacterium]|jgi:ribonuclease D|nr:ribonuclease D [Chromatiaceae bacterium]
MQERFVDTADGLLALCEMLKDSEWLALDTEFIREKTYYPRLCLIQICNGEVAACIDPLKLEDLQPLLDILYDGRILKVLHAARQDLEIFLHDYRQIPMPVFDTQPAAALLGHGDQVGYANLVKLLLDVELPKDQSRTDWSQRPLDDQQLRYALDDVVYLGQLYLHMRGHLFDRERLQWLAADFATLADPQTYYPNPHSMWKRTKGRQLLRGRQLAVLQRIAAWREYQARERDLPRKWVLKDEVMIELSRRMPRDAAGLAKIRGLEPGQIRREGPTLIELINEGAEAPRESWPQDKERAIPLTAQQEAMVDLLSAALRLIADQHQLSPLAIATRRELEKLVRGEPDCILLEGWRHLLAGESLGAIMRGERQVMSLDGELQITGDPAGPVSAPIETGSTHT